jgi:hypothetical protein
MRTARLTLAAVLVVSGVVAAGAGLGAHEAPDDGAEPAVAGPPPVPMESGRGRRVVYDMGQMRVWLVEADDSITRSYPVSGHEERTLPGVGTFWIYSTVRWNTVKDQPDVKLDFMMRFALGDEGLSIGFHAIPRKASGYIQSTDTLGTPASHGCVRQAPEDAEFLWTWAEIGTPVVVVDTRGGVEAAPPRRYPRTEEPPAVQNPWAGTLEAIDSGWPVPVPLSDQAIFSV